jgi:hypothetical protein
VLVVRARNGGKGSFAAESADPGVCLGLLRCFRDFFSILGWMERFMAFKMIEHSDGCLLSEGMDFDDIDTASI